MNFVVSSKMLGSGSGQFGFMKNRSKSVDQKELALEMRTKTGNEL